MALTYLDDAAEAAGRLPEARFGTAVGEALTSCAEEVDRHLGEIMSADQHETIHPD